MSERRPHLLPVSQWRVLDELEWRRHRAVLLGDDATDPDTAVPLWTGHLPDSFTVAERLHTRPGWLPESERDGAVWLRELVARRVTAIPALAGTHGLAPVAARHVHDQVRRLLDTASVRAEIGTATSAEASTAGMLWNQEIPYVIDRLIAWCLWGDAHTDPDPMPATVAHSHHVLADLLDWWGTRELPASHLLRVALTAGLLDLGVKGGAAACPPLEVEGYQPGTGQAGRLADELITVAGARPMPVDDAALLDEVIHGRASRLVWLTDDLIETGFDLLLIQRLVQIRPGLTVVIAPRSRRTDNDATYSDVLRMLSHPALAQLAEATQAGRVLVSAHGPGLAAPSLPKLHPALVRQLHRADAVVVRGGRNHELLTGTLNRPMWTGYVVVREFTESQAGYDARTAPLVFVHAEAGTSPWWGWRGRAHRQITFGDGRQIPACWFTIADRQHRASADPEALAEQARRLLDHVHPMSRDYPRHAREELATVDALLGQHDHTDHDHARAESARPRAC